MYIAEYNQGISVLRRVEDYDPVIKNSSHWVSSLKNREFVSKGDFALQSFQHFANRILRNVLAGNLILGVETSG
jgi:hypothetical protein